MKRDKSCKEEVSTKESTQLKSKFKSKIAQNRALMVYIIVGGYPVLKKALDERGWIENPDKDGKTFNLKWTAKKADLDFGVLQSHQFVNHFEKNTSITTKNGLCRNIRNLIWYKGEDIDSFFPRCFDLNDFGEFDDFVEDFKFSEAEKVLKCFDLEASSHQWSALDIFKALTALYICDRRAHTNDQAISRLVN